MRSSLLLIALYYLLYNIKMSDGEVSDNDPQPDTGTGGPVLEDKK